MDPEVQAELDEAARTMPLFPEDEEGRRLWVEHTERLDREQRERDAKGDQMQRPRRDVQSKQSQSPTGYEKSPSRGGTQTQSPSQRPAQGSYGPMKMQQQQRGRMDDEILSRKPWKQDTAAEQLQEDQRRKATPPSISGPLRRIWTKETEPKFYKAEGGRGRTDDVFEPKAGMAKQPLQQDTTSGGQYSQQYPIMSRMQQPMQQQPMQQQPMQQRQYMQQYPSRGMDEDEGLGYQDDRVRRYYPTGYDRRMPPSRDYYPDQRQYGRGWPERGYYDDYDQYGGGRDEDEFHRGFLPPGRKYRDTGRSYRQDWPPGGRGDDSQWPYMGYGRHEGWNSSHGDGQGYYFDEGDYEDSRYQRRGADSSRMGQGMRQQRRPESEFRPQSLRQQREMGSSPGQRFLYRGEDGELMEMTPRQYIAMQGVDKPPGRSLDPYDAEVNFETGDYTPGYAGPSARSPMMHRKDWQYQDEPMDVPVAQQMTRSRRTKDDHDTDSKPKNWREREEMSQRGMRASTE